MTIESILIIDDSDDFREITRAILEQSGYTVWDAACPHDAWQLLPREHFDLILCDLHMPFITGERQREFQVSYHVGILTIQELQDLFPYIPVVGITATEASDMYKIKNVVKGISVVPKPTSKNELLALVNANLPQSAML